MSTGQLPSNSMSHILTAEEFVTLVLAKLRLKAPDNFVLDAHSLDQRFETAYNWLSDPERKLEVVPNFTFRCDPLYGVTSTFRDALLSLRERGMIQPDSSRHGYSISLSEALAENYINDGALPSDLLDDLVKDVFLKISLAKYS